MSWVGHGPPARPPVACPFILLSAAQLRHPERFQAAEYSPPMARRQDVELQEPLLRELPAVVQGSVPRPQERRGVLGQAEGEQPLHNLLDTLRRLRHDAAISPLEHQGDHRNTEYSTRPAHKREGTIQLASSIETTLAAFLAATSASANQRKKYFLFFLQWFMLKCAQRKFVSKKAAKKKSRYIM